MEDILRCHSRLNTGVGLDVKDIEIEQAHSVG